VLVESGRRSLFGHDHAFGGGRVEHRGLEDSMWRECERGVRPQAERHELRRLRPSTQLKGGGFVALMVSDGRVVILSVKTHKTVSSRQTLVVRRSALRTAQLGDVVVVRGTAIGCDVIKVGGTGLCRGVPLQGPCGCGAAGRDLSRRLASFALDSSDG
jgi:hypothetical protein